MISVIKESDLEFYWVEEGNIKGLLDENKCPWKWPSSWKVIKKSMNYIKKIFCFGGFFGVEVEGYFYFFDIHRYAMASVSSSLRASEMLLLDRDRSFRKLVGIKSYLW